MLMIQCPVTLQDVPTGIITDQSSLQQPKSEPVQFSCPECAQLRHWSSSQTWLAEFKCPEAFAAAAEASTL
jgi:hypothetical protein